MHSGLHELHDRVHDAGIPRFHGHEEHSRPSTPALITSSTEIDTPLNTPPLDKRGAQLGVKIANGESNGHGINGTTAARELKVHFDHRAASKVGIQPVVVLRHGSEVEEEEI